MRMMLIAGLLLSMAGGAAAQEGDPEAGEKIFRRCQACHAVGEGAANKVGPRLNGVVGAEWGHVDDYDFSKVIIEGRDAGKVWDVETLDAFLTNPREVAPGTKMIFPGLRKEEERANVIAYLAQFGPDGTTQ